MSDFKGCRFPVEIILLCARWYCNYGISYRDLEEMMSERGVTVNAHGRLHPPQDDLMRLAVVCRFDRRDEGRRARRAAPGPTWTFAAKIGVVHLNLALQAFRRIAFEHDLRDLSETAPRCAASLNPPENSMFCFCSRKKPKLTQERIQDG